jgi:hypothetical protein
MVVMSRSAVAVGFVNGVGVIGCPSCMPVAVVDYQARAVDPG